MKKMRKNFFPLGMLLTAVFLMAAMMVYLCAFDPNVAAYVDYFRIIMVFQMAVMMGSYLLLLFAALPREKDE